MKKYLPFISAAALLLVASCEQEPTESIVTPEPVNEGVTVTFTATTESRKGATRTELNETKVLWSPEDRIKVFWNLLSADIQSMSFTADIDEPAETVDFTAIIDASHNVIQPGEPVIAAYPYDDFVSSDGNTVFMMVPSYQNPPEDSFDPLAFPSVAFSTSDDLQFYNVCGGIKLRFAREDICRVEIYGDPNSLLCGYITVGFDEKGIPVVQNVEEFEEGSNRVVIEPELDECFYKDHDYYVSVLPGSLGESLTFVLYIYDDVYVQYAKKVYSGPFTVKRNTFGYVSGFDKDLSYHTSFSSYPEPVDLGLSVMWGEMNLGADTYLGYGYYYAWGETEPKDRGARENYLWGNGQSSSSSFAFSKYNERDGKTVLDPADDVAAAKLGGTWRIPTTEDFEELLEECEWNEAIYYGIKGYIIRSRKPGYTENTIFLPKAGKVSDDGTNPYLGIDCYYWLSSLYPESNYSKANVTKTPNGQSRWFLLPVRPVCDRTTPVINPYATISFNHDYMSYDQGEMIDLSEMPNIYGAEYSEVTWSSSDPNIVMINEAGKGKTKNYGRATITATLPNGASASVRFIVYNPYHDYVDLGLPSGTLWATCNVGADYPEDIGEYIAWGELEPKAKYDWTTYRWCDAIVSGADTLVTFTKYGENVDFQMELERSDDAAFMNWGPNWRMPTEEECRELFQYTDARPARFDIQGEWKYVYIFTSTVEGYTDKYIYIPQAGYKKNTGDHQISGEWHFWLPEIYQYDDHKAVSSYYYYGLHRSNGLQIRPVRAN